MARDFDGPSDDMATVEVAPVTAAPITMCCWFRPPTATISASLMFLGDKDVTSHYFAVRAQGATAGDPVAAFTAAGGFANASTSTGFSANVWNHAAGVFAASNDRRAYLNGGGKGTNTTNRTPSGVDRVRIGRLGDSTPSADYTGRIAEATIWNVALTDDEVLALAGGVSCFRIRGGNIVGYWPLFGASPETDFSGNGNNLTLSGTTIVDHAPVAPMFGFDVWDRSAVATPPAGGGLIVHPGMTGRMQELTGRLSA